MKEGPKERNKKNGWAEKEIRKGIHKARAAKGKQHSS
jgi:hypothetical protein